MVQLIMFFFFQKIILSNDIQQVKPKKFTPTLSYTLTKYKPLNYPSIESCIKAETDQQNENASKVYGDFRDNYHGFQSLMTEDLIDDLLDKSNKLTNDEKAAIYLYSASHIFSDEFVAQTGKGKIGGYNCFMDYLLSGMKKMKHPTKNILYRGSVSEAQVIQSLKKDQKLILNSYTSTSSSFSIGKKYAIKGYVEPPEGIVGGIYVINTIADNSRNIQNISSYPHEQEYLYPPMTKFITESDPYIMHCDMYGNDCHYPNEITKESSKVWKIVFINVSEIDEKPEYIEEENPYPTPTETPKPSRCSSSSSCNDENEELSSKILGNFQIKTMYIGASVLYDFDIGYNIMYKARKSFGHVIPAPHFLHPAIWVGSTDANDDSVGAVFVYGKYFPKKNEETFILKDGAKSFAMSFGDFKLKYDAFNPIKIIPQKNLSIKNFTNEIKSVGNWNAKDYKWSSNNCQHFIAKCLNIAQAVRFSPNENDWINLPSKILKVLKSNEKNISQIN